MTGSDLVVTLSNGATITIPVGSSSANSVPVTVTRGDDAYVEGSTAETVSISSTAGGNYEAHDDDQHGHGQCDRRRRRHAVVTLTASAASVTEGGSVVYTASVEQCGDRQRPGGDAVQQRHDHDPGGQLEAPTACR